MSEKNSVTDTAITAKSFTVRNIKKEFTQFEELPTTAPQYHLELGENNEAVIVQDRDVDFAELANKDVDSVGLANILELARRRGDSLAAFQFKDEEALDLGDLDPMDPVGVNNMINAGKGAEAKLENIASQLGVTVDELVKSYIAGNVEALIKKGVAKDEEESNT